MRYPILAISFLLLLLVANTAYAQKWEEFDKDWITVQLDQHVSLQFPEAPVAGLGKEDKWAKTVATKLHKLHFEASYKERDSAWGRIQPIYDSLITIEKLPPDSAKLILWENIVKHFAITTANDNNGDIVGKLGYGFNIDRVPAHWFIILTPRDLPEKATFYCIFYYNNRFYTITLSCKALIRKKKVGDIWERYMRSTHIIK